MRVMILVVAGMMILVAGANPVQDVAYEQYETQLAEAEDLVTDQAGEDHQAIADSFEELRAKGHDVIYSKPVEDILDLASNQGVCVRGSRPLSESQATSLLVPDGVDAQTLVDVRSVVGTENSVGTGLMDPNATHSLILIRAVAKPGLTCGTANYQADCDYESMVGCNPCTTYNSHDAPEGSSGSCETCREGDSESGMRPECDPAEAKKALADEFYFVFHLFGGNSRSEIVPWFDQFY